MSRTAIVADSTAGLTDAYAEEHSIAVVPLYLNIEDKIYRDEVDIHCDEFYERLPKCSILPTTSQPSAGDFQKVYRRLKDDGYDSIVSIHLSSGLSGTVNSACLAREDIDGIGIEVVDTKSACMSHMFAVEAAVNVRAQGGSFEEIVAAAQAVSDAQKTVFMVDTLEYLYKGGRIGGASALLGSLLQFKPLLYFNDGCIDALERVRTATKAHRRMGDIMADWLGTDQLLETAVMHAAAPDNAEKVAGILPGKVNVANMRIVTVSPVLGAHVGNGTLGVCCCPKVLMHNGDAAS